MQVHYVTLFTIYAFSTPHMCCFLPAVSGVKDRISIQKGARSHVSMTPGSFLYSFSSACSLFIRALSAQKKARICAIRHRSGLFCLFSDYLMVTFAPTSSRDFLRASASSLETAVLTIFGAESTSSLASFRPREVASRTTLITLTF